MTFCDFCGDVLDEDEEERSENFKHDVCDECILRGLEEMKKKGGKKKKKRAHKRFLHHVRKKARRK